MRERFKKRGQDSETTIENRLNIAKSEIKRSKICNYSIKNEQGKLDQCVDEIYSIIKSFKDQGAIMISPEGGPNPEDIDEEVDDNETETIDREALDKEAGGIVSAFESWLSNNQEKTIDVFNAEFNRIIDMLEQISENVGIYGSIWKGYYHCVIGLAAHRSNKDFYPSDRLNSDFDALEDQLEQQEGPETEMWNERIDQLLA